MYSSVVIFLCLARFLSPWLGCTFHLFHPALRIGLAHCALLRRLNGKFIIKGSYNSAFLEPATVALEFFIFYYCHVSVLIFDCFSGSLARFLHLAAALQARIAILNHKNRFFMRLLYLRVVWLFD
jgi:hypothetical protein